MKLFALLRLCGNTLSDLSIAVMLHSGRFVLFLGERLTGDAIFAFNPATEIDELAPFGAKGAKGVFFPLDWPTAGWAFHES